MRTFLWAVPIFVALGACGAHVRGAVDEPTDVPLAHRSVSPSPAVALATVPPPSVSMPVNVAPTGTIENAENLHRFFDALAEVDDGTAASDATIIQLGDSHTAADIGTGAARKVLQTRFGDGGRGFVALGRPWRTYAQDGVRGKTSREWKPEHGKFVRGKSVGDGMYGLAGWSLVTSRRGATLSTDVGAPASKIELAYLELPNGGSFDVEVDGTVIGRVKTKGKHVKSGFASFDVQDKPHHIEIRTTGDGVVRLFGMTLDRERKGVTLDALGINGERALNVLDWNEAHFTEQLRHRDPQLVVLAYGTNESGDETTPAAYEQTLVELVGRVARAVPSASCLFLGPQDRAIRSADGGWETSPKIPEIIEVQRRVAKAAGCGFFDQYAAMGGAGSMASWATESPPRGRGDRVHFTRQGYVDLGTAFANALAKAYDDWRAAKGLPPSPQQPELLTPPSAPSALPAASPLISYPTSRIR